MACPYFYPIERLSPSLWPHPDRLPLGDGFGGVCLADPNVRHRPDDETARQFCNLGYARGQCPRFPDNGAADAVRFMVAADLEGLIRIQYAFEQNHRPHRHGELQYDRRCCQFSAPPESPIFQRQAEAYVESYRRRKLEL